MHFIFSLIIYLLGLVELALVLRIILQFLTANAMAIVVRILYSFTDFLVFPFEGIFSNIRLNSGGIFDIAAFSAIIGYAILGFLLIKLLNLLFRDF